MSTKPLRILSLDGDSIRGLHTASILDQLGMRLARYHKNPIEKNIDIRKWVRVLFPRPEAHMTKLVKILEPSKSSYPSISPVDIFNLSMTCQNEKQLLIKSSEFSNPIFSKVAEGQSENIELAKLCDWLHPILMNGQVTTKC